MHEKVSPEAAAKLKSFSQGNIFLCARKGRHQLVSLQKCTKKRLTFRPGVSSSSILQELIRTPWTGHVHSVFCTSQRSLNHFLSCSLAAMFGALCCCYGIFKSVTLIIGFCWCAHESLQNPRSESCETWFEVACTLMALIGDVLLIPYYFLFGGELPEIVYIQNETNETYISRCPSLDSFKHTCWLHNAYLSFITMLLRERLWKDVYQREILKASDGGKVALDWYCDSHYFRAEKAHDVKDVSEKAKTERSDESDVGCNGQREYQDLPPEAPIMLLVTTLVGGPMSYPNGKTLFDFAQGGYRCVCYVKRGCGIQRPNPYTSVKSWCLSDYEDLTMAIDHISERYPRAKIVSVGVSTGGGQLRNYLSRFGAKAKIAAAIVVDAGYSWDHCVLSLDRRNPFLAKALAMATAASYVEYADVNPEVVKAAGVDIANLRSADSMEKLIAQLLGPTNGFSSAKTREYMHYCCPGDPASIAIPTMNLFTMNDQIISQEDMIKGRNFPISNPNIINVTTQRGTHVIRWEGLLGKRCWVSQVALEFCNAVLAGVQQTESSKVNGCFQTCLEHGKDRN